MLTRFSILRTACSTVVWSRPPNLRPISGSERDVSRRPGDSYRLRGKFLYLRELGTDGEPLRYGKTETALRNPGFVAWGQRAGH